MWLSMLTFGLKKLDRGGTKGKDRLCSKFDSL